MEPIGSELAYELRQLKAQLQKRDTLLAQAYLVGGCVSVFFLFLPFQLSRIGGALLVLSLAHMMCKIYAAHRQSSNDASAWQTDLVRIHARIAVTQSAFYILPFLVGANLVFMGLPLPINPVQEAALDCGFLGLTVLLFGISHWINHREIRRCLQPLEAQLAPLIRRQSRQPRDHARP